MLNIENTVLAVIDVQEKLSRVMFERDALISHLSKLVRGIQLLAVPVIRMEQNPKGLGTTVPEVAESLMGNTPIPKMSFSACGENSFLDALRHIDRHQVLLVGIEAHVCVYQTAMDLLDAGYEVHVVSDCVSSRTPENKDMALKRMRDEGVKLTGAEMVLFELLKGAEAPQFKEISRIVK